MSKSWIIHKRDEFVRDILRDFCLVSVQLDNEFRHYDHNGLTRFTFFKDLLGARTNKGQIWRLKDTAHLLFRNEPEDSILAHYLDWAIGYIFHECIKLMEDSYQRRRYKPWFESHSPQQSLAPEEMLIGKELHSLIEQTRESIDREIKRVRFLLFHCRRMLTLYLPAHRDNALLARFIYDQNHLVRQVFGSGYDDLIHSVYSNAPDQLFILAAHSLEQGGWHQEAVQARKAADTKIRKSPHPCKPE
ncbi:MAG: hypothetical protein CSA21_02360 [Deltaproteobacteria bacterium]|nr:MAG: hypothetical protein CSA21_02360 [Deltaproteobacteria bacterium]